MNGTGTPSNTSATGGYLSPEPQTPAALTSRGLDQALQSLVQGITRLPGNLVRPRAQENPPPRPDADVNWAAVAAANQTPDWTGIVTHENTPEGIGRDVLLRYETFDLMASFYGPLSRDYADLLVDSLLIAQNRWELRKVGVAVVGVRSVRNSPDLLNQRWFGATDVEIEMRREIRKVYPVLNLVSSSIEFAGLPASVNLVSE